MDSPAVPLNEFIVKIASRCNLNCSYCYVYNKGDLTWKERPAIMSNTTFQILMERIRHHCHLSGQKLVSITFHGGEPCLVGPEQLDLWCALARRMMNGVAGIRFYIQTNGTLLNPAWLDVFRKHDVQVGISMDGPRELHNVYRLDHAGRGSYDAVAQGLRLLREANMPFSILSVIQLGSDPLAIHHHFVNLGCATICYLLPAYTHDTIDPIRQRYGSTPCADFLIPIFDDWWYNGTLDVRIREFWNIARLILGGTSQLDSFGNPPLRFLAVETDGEIHGLDKLRICEEGMTKTGFYIQDADFYNVMSASTFHAGVIEGMPLPQDCYGCPEQDTCGGGYLPHRYSRARGFNNRSVWCADLLQLFSHIRQRLQVSVEETRSRREVLHARASTST